MVQDPSDPRSQFLDVDHPSGLQDFLNVTIRFMIRNVFLLLLFSIITVGNVIIIIALAKDAYSCKVIINCVS